MMKSQFMSLFKNFRKSTSKLVSTTKCPEITTKTKLKKKSNKEAILPRNKIGPFSIKYWTLLFQKSKAGESSGRISFQWPKKFNKSSPFLKVPMMCSKS